MSGLESWSKIVLVQADCLTCGADAGPLGFDSAESERARRWARRHAEQHPGHHTIHEVTRGRSYRSSDES